MAASPKQCRIGNLLVDVGGERLTAEDREVLLHPLVGGVVLFVRNYADPEQARILVDEIHALRTPRLLVTVDQEGGVVQRFRQGLSRLPSLRALGQEYDRDPQRAARHCSRMGWLMAVELRALDVDLSFAPVLDLHWGHSRIIGHYERAFHSQPYVVRDLAAHYIAGMHRAGMRSVCKHFPGHGSVRGDSHTEHPEDPRSLRELRARDLLPFENLEPARRDGLMTAHVVFPDVDPVPVTYSHRWIQHILRDRMNFTGALFSDDLSMNAARLHEEEADDVSAAYRAGCDVVLLCNNRAGVHKVLDRLGDYHNPVASLRLLRMTPDGGPVAWSELRRDEFWKKAVRTAGQYEPGEPEQELHL